MATENSANVSKLPFVAGGTIAANSAVKLDSTAGQVVVTTAITDVVVGVVGVDAVAGEGVSVQIAGVAKVRCKSAVTLGDQVMPNGSSGDGDCDNAAGATAVSFGLALNTTANAGELVEVLLSVPNVNGPANS